VINANGYTLKTVERVFSSFPVKKPNKKKTEEEKKKQEEEEMKLKAMPRNETN